MEVRLTFRSEIFIEGKDLKEIQEKWWEMPLFSAEALEHYASEIEVVSVEDNETGKDLDSEFNHI